MNNDKLIAALNGTRWILQRSRNRWPDQISLSEYDVAILQADAALAATEREAPADWRNVERLRAALQPFANEWHDRRERVDYSLKDWEAAFENWADGEVGAGITFTWGELRAAARALAATESEAPADGPSVERLRELVASQSDAIHKLADVYQKREEWFRSEIERLTALSVTESEALCDGSGEIAGCHHDPALAHLYEGHRTGNCRKKCPGCPACQPKDAP